MSRIRPITYRLVTMENGEVVEIRERQFTKDEAKLIESLFWFVHEPFDEEENLN